MEGEVHTSHPNQDYIVSVTLCELELVCQDGGATETQRDSPQAMSVLRLYRKCGYCHNIEGTHDLCTNRRTIVIFVDHPMDATQPPVCSACHEVLYRCPFAKNLKPSDVHGIVFMKNAFMDQRYYYIRLREFLLHLHIDRANWDDEDDRDNELVQFVHLPGWWPLGEEVMTAACIPRGELPSQFSGSSSGPSGGRHNQA